LSFLLLPSLSLAYSFEFTSIPRQCGNLSISLNGTGGVPPYRVLIIPVGPSPLPNNVEARRITQQNFTGSDTTVTFQLKFPTNSQFVAVVSDSSSTGSGFGTGGTSGVVTVLAGDDSSCFDATTNVSPPFAYSIVPAGTIAQCTATRIWWDPAVVQGVPTFQGAIPGGQSFAVPQGQLTTVAEQGLGFTWTPSVRTGTTVILLGGDNRGPGTAGSAVFIVNQGDNSCLSDSSPSSTPGSPAGGSYPTSTSGAGTGAEDNSGSGSKTDVGAIVGGVVGGVVGFLAVLLVLLFFYRRSKFHNQRKHQGAPVDLLRDGDPDDNEPETTQLPQYYQPEPFVLPDPTVISSADDSDPTSATRPSADRRFSRYSGTTTSFEGALGIPARAGTPSGSTSTSGYMRKSPAPPSFRPVNIVQHEDAGPTDREGGEMETIELPPAYSKIRK
ncbi:hypothetical protein C8Q75DRAFT_706106, partial [Abortiporus biennis]